METIISFSNEYGNLISICIILFGLLISSIKIAQRFINKIKKRHNERIVKMKNLVKSLTNNATTQGKRQEAHMLIDSLLSQSRFSILLTQNLILNYFLMPLLIFVSLVIIIAILKGIILVAYIALGVILIINIITFIFIMSLLNMREIDDSFYLEYQTYLFEMVSKH